jgi:hypothetical protein
VDEVQAKIDELGRGGARWPVGRSAGGPHQRPRFPPEADILCGDLHVHFGPIVAMPGRQSADDDPPQFGRLVVGDLTTVEVKAFVPARDFALSKQFYQDLGFELAWSDDDLAYMRYGNSSFLLQNFYNEVHADNFMMHLLVTDVNAWWHYVQAQGIASKYDTKTEPPEDRPWGIRDFVLVDPTGVLWRIGQNISTVGKRT